MSALGRARQFIGFEGGTQYPILYECIARRTARSANSGMTIPPLQPGSLSVSEKARPIPNFCPNAESKFPYRVERQACRVWSWSRIAASCSLAVLNAASAPKCTKCHQH